MMRVGDVGMSDGLINCCKQDQHLPPLFFFFKKLNSNTAEYIA